jgi:NADPH-dependent ferric siderophore reductase
MSSEPRIRRVRHELKRRRLSVLRVEKIAPSMVRVVLGDEASGYWQRGNVGTHDNIAGEQ